LFRRELGLALALFQAAALAAPGQAGPSESYRQIVERYRLAPRTTPDLLAAWTASQIDEAVDAAVASRSEWTWGELRRAAVLHTDRWNACRSSACAAPAAHLYAAERLIDRVVGLERRQRYFAERWYDAAAGLLAHDGLGVEHAALMTRRAEKLPADPSTAPAIRDFRIGQGIEYVASIGRTSTDAPPGRLLDPASGWQRAAASYRAALRRAPDFHAAALRFGRMRMLQNVPGEAAEHFALAAKADDPRIVYLATLFLGALDERGGELDAAERHYRHAMGVYPSGQSAWMALAQLLSRTGREAESRQVMSALLRARRPITVDPLWTYLRPPQPDIGDVAMALDELRAEVLQ
jgi:tetratricopeptide (TPR) repeat protein